MTTAIFLILFFIFFVAVLNFLPTAGALPASFSSAFTLVVGYMKAWNFIFPVSELFVCVGIIVVYELIYWGWRALTGATRIVRGSTH